MERLCAKYDVRLPQSLIVKRREDDRFELRDTVNEFDVVVTFVHDYGGARKRRGERQFTRSYSRIFILVSRPETESPPAVEVSEKGTRDYTKQHPYFDARRGDYGKVAVAAVRNVLSFFRHRLHQPVSADFRGISNPVWLDESGAEVGKGTVMVHLPMIPGLGPQNFGIRPLRKQHDAALLRALQKPLKPSLAQEFLADSQVAAFDGNLRRAVLELAIACEIGVKKRFFGSSSIASLAFEYFEGKGVLKTRALVLVDEAAKQIFGRSFRDEHGDQYECVDYLFRCRNKVAHRGNLLFRDNQGVQTPVTGQMVETWWIAVHDLFRWLRALPSP